VAICVFSGYYFGNLEIVRNNFSLVILAILVISVLPMVFEYLRHRMGLQSPNTKKAEFPSKAVE
jgi:membrane-associated protein